MNTVTGAAGGAAGAGILGGLGYLARPLIPAMRRRVLAGKVGNAIDTSPKAQRVLEGQIKASNQRIVDAPQTTAEVTQNPHIATMEMAARANPDTQAPFLDLAEQQDNGRWKALDEALGSKDTVAAAKQATDSYVQTTLPTVMKSIKPTKLSDGIKDLMVSSKGMLDSALANRNVWAAEVLTKLREEIKASNRSPQALWNVRKMLREWQEGTPPVGKEATRAPKADPTINQAVGAIDEVMNRSSGGTWDEVPPDLWRARQARSRAACGPEHSQHLLG
jgi:hypothetical protein